jgi:hypothetical protein
LPLLEEVFRRQGTPTYTFVEPARYNEIRLAMRARGRCVVIEGPSGIGKSTIVDRVLSDLSMKTSALTLSARKSDDFELIEEVLRTGTLGTVIVDDFHRLGDDMKARLADRMKVIADDESGDSKLILVGVNKAGDRLIDFSPDVAMRIDIFRLEANSAEKVLELVELGESVLNVSIRAKPELVAPQQQGMICFGECSNQQPATRP